MNYPAIVVAAYSRPKSLERLLGMLNHGSYPREASIPLVVSIDGGGADVVKAIANSFEWMHGVKKVIFHDRNLGLREHILRCGDLTEQYGAIIMLEDDLGVSPFFYEYTLQALRQFSEEEDIAGISLYKHLINVNCSSVFEPMDNGLGTFICSFRNHGGRYGLVSNGVYFVSGIKMRVIELSR